MAYVRRGGGGRERTAAERVVWEERGKWEAAEGEERESGLSFPEDSTLDAGMRPSVDRRRRP